MQSSYGNPLLEELKIEKNEDYSFNNFKPTLRESSNPIKHIVEICNKLVSMKYPPHMVFAFLKYFDVTNIESAINMLTKTEYGWEHSFIKNDLDGKTCKICSDEFKEHFEGKFAGMEEAFNIPELTIFSNTDIEELRTSVTCTICMEGIPLGHEFYLPCFHMFCKSCISDFLKEKITNRAILDLQCPEGDCKFGFNKIQLERLCSNEIFVN